MGQCPPVLPPAPAPIVTPNAQIAQVLNTAVEQVSQAVQDQVVSSRHPVEHSLELQALVRDPKRLACPLLPYLLGVFTTSVTLLGKTTARIKRFGPGA